jgi:lipid-A-disaccharide synthase
VTGELSGEMHAVRLVAELQKRLKIDFSGLGSDRFRQCGIDVVHDYRHISLMGISEVLSKMGHVWDAYRALKDHLLKTRPSLVILVDFPGFNLRIARVAHRLGIPTVYFIPPQVWAWRKNRVQTIKKNVDLVISVLPFEKPFYEEQGIECFYVGHPFTQTVKPLSTKADFLAKLGISPDRTIVTIMPGSRDTEIKKHLMILLKTVEIIGKKIKNLTVLMPLADNTDEATVAPLIGGRKEIISLRGSTYDALSVSRLALIASGSATLEAAILGTPSIVLYRLSALSYLLARFLVKVRYVSLPNLIAGKEVFPEYIQHLDAERIAEKALSMLNSRGDALKREMEEIREKLGHHDSYGMASERIVQYLERLYGPLPATA